MARVVVMYKTPRNASAFDKYYFETHVPIAKKIPGLRKYEVSRGAVTMPAGPLQLPSGRDPAFRRCCRYSGGVRQPGGEDCGRRSAELRQ